jgi:DNA polymerase-1
MTMLGRRRYLPELKATDQQERAPPNARRSTHRYKGSAADLIKLAMLLPLPPPATRGGCPAAMILQVHD